MIKRASRAAGYAAVAFTILGGGLFLGLLAGLIVILETLSRAPSK